MKKLFKDWSLGTQLNVAFFVALFVPMVVASLYSVVYYSDKIQQEALNKVSTNLELARVIYDNQLDEIKNLAISYAQKSLAQLFNLGINEKLGEELAKTAQSNGLDMIFAIDKNRNVVARSHNSTKYKDFFGENALVEKGLQGESFAGTELLNYTTLQKEEVDWAERIKPGDQVISLTGVSPIYNRDRTQIMGVILVRQILNGDTTLPNAISKHIKADTVVFAHIIPVTSNQEDLLHHEMSQEIAATVIVEGMSYEEAIIKEGGHLAKYQPLRNVEGTAIGALMVKASAQSYVETRQFALISMALISLVGFGLAFSIKFVIQRRILVPIHRLEEGTEVIAKGDYSHQLKVTSQDEIGLLAQSFNKMARDLKSTYEKLEEYNRELEAKVAERTAELQHANKRMHNTLELLGETLESLNPGVSELISNGKQHLGLIVATEFITDLVGYTRLNMIAGEQLIGSFMTQFFRESHKLLARYFGFRDKTIGDQIVAMFGIPKDHNPASPYHPFDAVFCALQLSEVVESINMKMRKSLQENYSMLISRVMALPKEDQEHADIDDLSFRIRIGINTSNPETKREIDQLRMVMMGAETGVDYTGQGGALIYASRLESAGTPGEIHIGENTKIAIEHIFELEELPTVRLKGLGVQNRYKVLGPRSLFATIYPRTRFFQEYNNKIPNRLHWALNSLKLGTMEIHEVRKLETEMDVTIAYMEHCAGVYKVCMARALFAYAIANELGLSEQSKDAIIVASVWFNQSPAYNNCITYVRRFTISEQLPPEMDGEAINLIIQDLQPNVNSPMRIESQIIQIANQFDQMTFDRTYLRQRQSEVSSPREVIKKFKASKSCSPEVLATLSALFIPEVDDTIRVNHTLTDPDGVGF